MEEKEVSDIIMSILRKERVGLCITEIVNKTNLSRSAVRTALASLSGAGKIKLRRVGVAKIYIVK